MQVVLLTPANEAFITLNMYPNTKNNGIIRKLIKNNTPTITNLDQSEVGYLNESDITSPISINIHPILDSNCIINGIS